MTPVMRPVARRALFLLLLALSGCASTPSSVTNGGSTSGQGPQIIVTLTTAGMIDPVNDHYYILFNTSNDPTGANGPVPVVTSQNVGGNGFAAGKTTPGGFTHFVLYDSTGFGFYTVLTTDLRTFSTPIAPINPQVSGTTLRFQIPLSYLATTAIPVASITSLQVNVVTTNLVSTNPNDTRAKYFDSLGDPTQGGLNDYITLSTQQSRLYEVNATSVGTTEAAGDVAQFVGSGYQLVGTVDPNDPITQQAAAIDITDLRVEVRD